MSNTSLLSQPKQFYLIFMLEFWERFGYYGVQAVLILFMVTKLGFADKRADLMVGAFSALAYLLPSLGGWVGDKILGTKRCILLGAFTLGLGYLLMSLPGLAEHNIALPLAVIIVGNGLFKANPSSLLSKVYDKTSANVDSGFTLFYMAINIGAFLSLLLVPILSHLYGWNTGFVVCFVGLFLGLITFLWKKGWIAKVGSGPDLKPLKFSHLFIVITGCVAVAAISYLLLKNSNFAAITLVAVTIIYLMFYVLQILRADKKEQPPMWLFLILFFEGVVFFILYIQIQTSLTLFALRNITHNVLGIPLQPGSFQALNPFWIIVMSPILAAVYQKLTKQKKDFSIPTKFSVGIMLAGASFIVLWLVTKYMAVNGVISGSWLLISYGLQSTGELLVSALGLAVASKFVPQRLMGFAMGIWLLSISVASSIGGLLASTASIPRDVHSPLQSLPLYRHLFAELGFAALLVGVLCLALTPLLNKLQPKHI